MQTKNDVVNIIKILPFFSEFGGGDIGELASFMSLRQVPAETELFRAGDVGDFLFFLIEGEVEVVVAIPALWFLAASDGYGLRLRRSPLSWSSGLCRVIGPAFRGRVERR